MATVIHAHNPFNPSDRSISRCRRGRTLQSLAKGMSGPFICLVNGKAMLRATWQYRVRRNDTVSFVALPAGGGGSNPMRIILMLAVMIFAPYLAQPLATATGMTVSMAQAAIGLVGSALVNALIPPERPPSAAQASPTAASPTYALAAQGNAARIGEPIPDHYGRHICFPDFAAKPYVEYSGNEQYLYQLFCIGQGSYSLEQMKIADSPIENFEEVETQIINPGESITLFPYNVTTNDEIAGQDMVYNEPVGPFTVNAAGTQANAIAFDLVAPRGLYYANNDGSLATRSVTSRLEARKIDADGAPIGGWIVLGTPTISAASATPQRLTYRYNVAPGRYEVRATRISVKDTSTRVGHDLTWAGAKAYLTGAAVIPGVTLVALKMRATNNLSSTSSRLFNVVATRQLPTWHPDTGWSAPVPYRRGAWAAVNVLRTDGRLPDRQIDLQAFYELDQIHIARGDRFDGRFDSRGSVWDSCSQILRAGRAKQFWQGGRVSVVRDQAQAVPVGMFSMRNIVRGSFSVEYLAPTEETADAVDIEYFDETVWKWATVRCYLPGSLAQTVITDRLFGVTNRDQAWREGMYMMACNKYRRRLPSLSTEMEGFIPTFGDYCVIAHDMPQWGQSGAVVGWDEGMLTLEVSEPLQFGDPEADHYIGLRRKDGSVAGPYIATPGADDTHVVLDDVPDFDLILKGSNKEPTHYAFGQGETWRLPVRALGVRPRSLEKVDMMFVVDDPAVHTADTGVTPPPTSYSQLPTIQARPVVTGLIARSMPDAVDRAVLSWKPATGTNYYAVEQSADGESWTRSGETSVPNFSCTALYGNATIFRVAAVGLGVGPWAVVGYAAGAGYMWNPDDSTLMWNPDDSTPMWS